MVEFEVSKYSREDAKSGFMYVAYPKDGTEFRKARVHGENVYRLFGEILNLKEKYKFNRLRYKNISNLNLCPPLEYLDDEEMEFLERMKEAPVMREGRQKASQKNGFVSQGI